jgi:nucleotide-binding universal stress UspA family protein
MKTVFISLDESPYSIKAAKTGIALAKSLDAKICLLYVAERIESTEIISEEKRLEQKNKAMELMMKMKDMFNCPGAYVFIEEGVVSDKILEIASAQQSDLIVMGTHGKSGFQKECIGSVAEEVLKQSKIPVLVVPFRSIDKIKT